MRYNPFSNLFLFIFSLVMLYSCTSKNGKVEEYEAIYKRDTAYLRLNIYGETYHGHLTIKKPSNITEKGEVEGKIIGDTLLGDYLYTPYKAKLKKRRALVFKREGGTLLQGFGLEKIFMGIPHFNPNSLHFDGAKFIFHPISN